MDGFFHLTIHGIFHRVLWFILFVVAMIGCYFTTARLFEAREILVLNEETTISTFDIPFPAVTVCTTVKADHRIFDYKKAASRVWHLDENEDEFIYHRLFQRVLFSLFGSNRPISLNRRSLPSIFLNEVNAMIEKLGIKDDDLVTSCSINKKSCNWSKVLTPDGLCYAFNLVSPDEMFYQNIHKQYEGINIRAKGWSYKNGYDNNDFDTDVYPLRGIATNKDHELKIRLQMNINDIVNSNEKINGFAIYVGHPMDYPYHQEKRVLVPLNVQYTLNVVPDMILADDELKNYPLEARRCLIDESEWDHIQVFKKYTMNNCQLECTAALSLDRCGCIQFFIPSPYNRTCGSDPDSSVGKSCYQLAIPDILVREAIAVKTMDYSEMRCNCTPPCSSLTYDVRETMTGVVAITNETFHFSDIIVRFSSSEFLPKRRQESYSDLDVLSAIGGTLGLFVGGSVMSVIEVVYYFSIKICFDLLSLTSKN